MEADREGIITEGGGGGPLLHLLLLLGFHGAEACGIPAVHSHPTPSPSPPLLRLIAALGASCCSTTCPSLAAFFLSPVPGPSFGSVRGGRRRRRGGGGRRRRVLGCRGGMGRAKCEKRPKKRVDAFTKGWVRAISEQSVLFFFFFFYGLVVGSAALLALVLLLYRRRRRRAVCGALPLSSSSSFVAAAAAACSASRAFAPLLLPFVVVLHDA